MIVLENTAAPIMSVLEMENVVVLGNVLMKDVTISVPQTLSVMRMNIVAREEILGLGLSVEMLVLKVVLVNHVTFMMTVALQTNAVFLVNVQRMVAQTQLVIHINNVTQRKILTSIPSAIRTVK